MGFGDYRVGPGKALPEAKLLPLVDDELRKLDPSYALYRSGRAPLPNIVLDGPLKALGRANPWSDFTVGPDQYVDQVYPKPDTVI